MGTAADVEAVGFHLKTNRALLLIVGGGLRPVVAEPEPVGDGEVAIGRARAARPSQGSRALLLFEVSVGPRRTGAALERACLPANGLDPGDLASAQFEIARQLGADARYQAGGSPPDGCGIREVEGAPDSLRSILTRPVRQARFWLFDRVDGFALLRRYQRVIFPCACS